MVKKKRPAGKKKKGGKSRIWWAWFLAICLFCLFTFAAAFYLVFLHQADVQPEDPEHTYEDDSAEKPEPVVPPHELTIGKHKKKVDAGPVPKGKPLIAIVIDDMGQHREIGRQLIELDLPLSFAFLPGTPYAAALANAADAKGRDILLHIPMEPVDRHHDPGPGALLTSMSVREIQTVLEEDLAAFPAIKGANNHMGSSFTADAKGMDVVLEILNRKGLFFLDSVTTGKSVAYERARHMGVKTGQRQVFLDNDQEKEKITTQLFRLAELAELQGQAIAIGHPYPATFEAIVSAKEKLKSRVSIVGVGRLMH